MYGFSCTVYLVGKNATYTGELQLPASGDKDGIKAVLRRIYQEVAAWLDTDIDEGPYEVGVYLELAPCIDHDGTQAAFWRMMKELNRQTAMAWRTEVNRAGLRESEVDNG